MGCRLGIWYTSTVQYQGHQRLLCSVWGPARTWSTSVTYGDGWPASVYKYIRVTRVSLARGMRPRWNMQHISIIGRWVASISRSSSLMTKNLLVKFFLNYLCILFFVQPPWRTSLLQEKPPAFQRENPALKKNNSSWLKWIWIEEPNWTRVQSEAKKTATEMLNTAEEMT